MVTLSPGNHLIKNKERMPSKIIEKVYKMNRICKNFHKKKEKICLVPTMGALHKGHLNLVKKAKKLAERVIVSIFVNPTQFGKNEDYEKYPREIEKDIEKLSSFEVDCIFYPSVEEMYPDGYETYVELEKLPNHLCGLWREGHFRGVATVVLKLFNICEPHFAVFGEKDYQQLMVIKKMVRDLNLPVKVISCPTVREKDGLAMSSRNSYLTPEERKRATVIYRTLKQIENLIHNGENNAFELIKIGKEIIEKEEGRVQYLNISDPETLNDVQIIKKDVLIATAVYFGKTRLIDNIIVRCNST